MDYLGVRLDLFLCLIAFVICFVFYPIWINFVYRMNMGEVSRVHDEKQGTPTMGGFVFVLAVFVVTILFNRSRTQTLLPLFIACLAGLLGLIDDLAKVYSKSGLPVFFQTIFALKPRSRFSFKGIPVVKWLFAPWDSFKEVARTFGSDERAGLETYRKFLIQGVIAGFVAYWAYFKLGWDYIWMPLLGNIHLGLFYCVIVFVLFIVIFNAVSFTDGLDGLAGGLALFCFITFWVLSRVLGYNSLAGFCATFVGTLLPFLYFNVYPARIMMGNVGSHVLGATLAVLSVLLHREIALLIIGAVFLIDGVSSPLQQLSVKFTGKRILRMAPLHHHFEKLGWPETKVTLRFWVFGIVFSLFGFFISLL